MMDILSSPSYLCTPLIVALCNLLLVAIVWRWSRKDFSSHVFVALLLSLTLWSSILYGMRSSPNLHSALLWDRALPASTMLTFILYYHFTVAYTDKYSHRKFVVFSYIFFLIVIAMSPTNLLIKSMRLENYGYAPNLGIAAQIIFLAFPLLIFGGTYNLIRRYRVSSSPADRNRLLYLVIGTVFLLLGTFLDAFSNLPPVAIWTNLLFAIVCSVAIMRYHLLDIRLVVRTSLVYLITSVIFAIPYLLLMYILIVQLQIRVETWWIHALVIIVAAVTLRPLYTKAQHIVDKLFYRERYDHLIALESFIQETHDIRDIKHITYSLGNLIGRALQSTHVNLLLSTESGDFIIAPTYKDAPRIKLLEHEPILRWLRTKKSLLYRKDLAIIPQLQSLTKNETGVLQKTQAELIIPILTKGKELVGLIILSRKLSQLGYSDEDERLILAVANRMATELENAHLYDTEKIIRQQLEIQDTQKTEFLHSVAHELKTPLTAILSSSELLGRNLPIEPKLRKRIVDNVQKSAFSMNRRVAELLDLARIQIGQLDIKPEPLEINKAITEVAEQLDIVFAGKEQTLNLELPSSLPKVNADKEKLEQVLFNLLSNANKFSPTGSKITLKARKVGRKVIIEVEDSASPITEGEKKRIFDPYYRGEDSMKKDRFPGLGLGLYVSKRIVELHQGEIWVENKAGKGNIFAFSLVASRSNN